MNQINSIRPENAPSSQTIKGGFSLKTILPLSALVAGMAVFFAFGLDQYLSFEALRENRVLLTNFVAESSLLAALVFMAIYAIVVAFSLPGGAIMTITGGFLFGNMFGTAWVVLSATLGATVLFIIAKTSLGNPLRKKAGPWLKTMEKGFRKNALNYLLVLRLIPLFPFFVVNLVPAFLGVRLRTYVIGTLMGIVPGSFVFTTVGAGLGSIFDKNEAFTLTGMLTPEIFAALAGLSLLSLLPVAYKTIKAQ